jgi:signal transduction histidine kinase/CheY-like chemotaxis protein/ligand-binding sensor domain-containing protein/AraC-like DNA-binding protein
MKNILIITFLLLTCSRTIAQEGSEKPFIRFKNLSDDVASVLSKERNARCFFHDSQGFIWIGDLDGFKCYDGRSLKEYKLKVVLPKSKEKPYADMMVTAITEDHLGNIWAFVDFYKMYHLDRKTDIVTTYPLGNPGKGRFTSSRDFTRCMFEDSKNRLWVSTDDGFKRFDWETKIFIAIPYDAKTHTGWLFEDKEGQLWEVLTEGVKCLDSENNIFIPFQNRRREKQKIEDVITRVIQDKSGNLWIGTYFQGLYHFDKNTKLLTQYKNNPQNTNSLVINTAIDIVEDYYGRIWIANDNGGLVVFDPLTKQFHRYQADSHNTNAITSTPFVLFKDKNHGIWIIHFVKGISYIGHSTKNFRNFMDRTDDPKGLNDSYIQYFLERPDGNIWFATAHEGLCLWDRKRNTFEQFRHDPNNPNSLKGNLTGQIIEDKTGLVWVEIRPGDGIDRFDYKNKQFKHYAINGRLSLDKDGEPWVANKQGAHKYNYKTGVFDLISSSLYGQYVVPTSGLNSFYGLTADSKGNYWVSSTQGFCKYNLTTKELTDCINGNFGFIKNDSKGNFWILLGVQGDTLIKYNPTTKIFSDTVIIKNQRDYRGNCMVIDDKDQIWIGTVNGLYKFNSEEKTMRRYDVTDGLASNYMAFIPYALKTRRGELLFASTKGFTIFHPDDIRENLVVPPVSITRLKIKEVEAPVAGSPQDTFPWETPLKQHIHFTESITLKHAQNDFTIEFAALNYDSPQKNQYKYKLEGYDKDWIPTPASARVAKYTNLPFGRYTFRVIASNNDGVWNEQGDSLEIVILPPWWRTWWAYLFYVALIGGGSFLFYRFQLNRHLEQAEARRLKELDAVKTKLYTNITHEFRTPLTVILGMAREAFDKPKEQVQEAFKMIIRNGQNLLNLVNQMLDLRKLESGKLALHYQQGDVVNFLKYLVESFHSLAENKGVRIHFLTDFENLTMDYDETRLQQVVFNLISNAVKFTPKNGNIYVSVHNQVLMVPTQSQVLILKIKDTGSGITEGSLPFIFDRFYQADDSHTRQGEGTGIGLALTKELVKLMEGTISVKSQIGKGTEFEVKLPIRQIAEYKEAHDLKEPLQLAKQGVNDLILFDETQPLIFNQNNVDEKPIVLIADDNADVQAYIASCLAADYQLEIAKNGQECEEIAFETTPDLIVLDVMMPFKDGFEVCKILKNDERTSHIPIIMLTAKADIESKLQGLERGADAYLMKPFNKEELLVRIKKLLELRQQLQKHFLLTLSNSEIKMPDISNNKLPSKFIPSKNIQSQHTMTEGVPNVPAIVADSINVENAFVIKVRKTIETHLTDAGFDVEKLSHLIALSPSQVHRKLLALTGLTTINFIRYIRLAKAKELLLNSGYTINAIAYDSGFNDPAYFIRVFKQEFGMTPQVWREQNTV